MSTESILARVRDYVTESYLYMRPDFTLGDDDNLLGNGVLDSMGVIELTEFLASEFGIEIADNEITESNLGTLRSIAQYVTSKKDSGKVNTAYEAIGAD